MKRGTGIDWKNVTFITGHRENITPDHWRKNAFTRECENCGSKTYLEIEYPLDVPVLCNVCAAQIAAESEQDPSTKILYDLPDDLKERLTEMARQKGFAPEVVIKYFIEWKLGRPIQGSLYNKSGKKDDE